MSCKDCENFKNKECIFSYYFRKQHCSVGRAQISAEKKCLELRKEFETRINLMSAFTEGIARELVREKEKVAKLRAVIRYTIIFNKEKLNEQL